MIKFLLLINIAITNSTTWHRIPQDKVDKRVSHFLNTNNINNCFEYEENDYNLHLKCLINDKITNINIIIEDEESIYI
jgi:hypothetical protein